MSSKEVRFRSAFICEVIISDESIELIDSGHMSFYIDKSSQDLMEEFKDWFVNVYKACKPQTPTVLQYHNERSGEGEVIPKVDKLVYPKQQTTTILNEGAVMQLKKENL